MRALYLRTLSGASLATLATLSTPAFAQTETTQADAQQVNTQIACDKIADARERQRCVDTQGEGKLPQGGAPEGDQIVVTGSRIARPNYDTLQPSVVIDAQQIENRGFETLGQAINEQPSFGVPGASPVGAGQAGGFGSGQSFVNFLGLGDQRTLVLINGRRFVSSNTASIFGPSSAGLQVDLNAINTRLVDRIETIAIGGAPIYGSDAIAGTVNVVLKRNYQGTELDAQYGIAEAGDAPNYRIRGIVGRNFMDGRANVTVSGEYNRGHGILYNDRKASAANNFYDACPAGSQYQQCLYANRRIPSISESGIPTVGGDAYGLNFPLSPAQSEFLVFGDPSFNFGVQDAQGNQLMFNPSGQLIPIIFGQDVGNVPNGDFTINFSGGNGYNLNNTQQLLTDTERYNTNLLASFQVTDNVRLFLEGWYASSKAVQLRNQPLYNSGLFGAAGEAAGPIIVSVNNPYLTAAQRAAIVNSIQNNPFSDVNQGFVANQDYFYLSRANTDIISSRASSRTQVYRFVGGLDGSFNLGWRKFTWEAVANYGRADGKGHELSIDFQNFLNAVNAVSVNGQIVCAPGAVNSPATTISSTCAPINLFGSGQMSQAAKDYVTAIATPSSRNEQLDFVASTTGPIARLPGGDLKIALGVEHRRESTSFDPSAFYFGGSDPTPNVDENGDGDPTNDRVSFGQTVPILPVSGHYHTNEVFGEVNAALISPSNNIPFVRMLELDAAARYVDHSIAGGDWTWTAGGRFAPVRDITFRGNYTRAIRAPAITEEFNPSSSFFGFASDPCDRHNQTAGPDPATRQKNCAAAGVPANFSALSNQRSFPQAIAGNPILANEKSNAWSVGAVLTPRFIRKLRISADYIDIKLRNAITSFSGTDVVSACYDSTSFPNNQFCSRVRRDAAHQLSFIQTSYFNAATYRYKGILAALDYRFDTPFLGAGSRVGVNASYQYLHTLTQKATPTSAPATIDGTLGYPHHSAVVNLNYQNGPIGLFTSVNYTGPVNQAGDEPANFREHEHLKGIAYVNSGFAIDVSDRFRFHVSVDNILGTGVPYPVPAFGGAVSYFPGLLGRYFRAGAEVRF
jgi:outer membrane receptor protein involved in Fe transport